MLARAWVDPYSLTSNRRPGALAAEEPTALRTPRDVNEAKEILARAFEVPADKLAERFGMDEEEFEANVTTAISGSYDQKGPFVYHWASVQALPEQAKTRDFFRSMEAHGPLPPLPSRRPSSTTPEATPVANQSDDLTALGREVSSLEGKGVRNHCCPTAGLRGEPVDYVAILAPGRGRGGRAGWRGRGAGTD